MYAYLSKSVGSVSREIWARQLTVGSVELTVGSVDDWAEVEGLGFGSSVDIDSAQAAGGPGEGLA